uniref:Uricase n=1 Tax=Cyprinus carpio TaxID=7962 RepID=A0A8C1IUP5_CYPCA
GLSNVEFVRTGYRKNAVKVLHIRREVIHHHITELIADIQLTLKTHKDYLTGDNSDIIPTDTIKNTVHALAKLKGIKTIEGFAMDICEHFLTAFNHVTRVRVNIDEVPWKRLEKNGVEHTHASIHCPEAWQFCEVEQHLSMTPVVHNGIKDIKVLKTTLSGFESLYGTIFTTLTDAKDRFFCTSVYARWKTVKDTIIQKFAGPYDQVLVLDRIPQVTQTDFNFIGLSNKDEGYNSLDNPSGNITGTVCRKPRAKM